MAVKARVVAPQDVPSEPEPRGWEPAEVPAALGPGQAPTGELFVLPLVLLPETGVRLQRLAEKLGCTLGEGIQRAVDELVSREGT